MWLLKTLASLLLTVFMISEVELPFKRKVDCPFDLDVSTLPAMVLKVKNTSNLPQLLVDQCLHQKLTKLETIAVIDRVSEKDFLKEMKRQSKLPVSPESVIQIGKLLAPDHHLLLTDRMINISAIESGKLLYSRSFKFEPLSYNFHFYFNGIIKLLISLPIFILSYYLIYLFFLPVQAFGKKMDDNYQANKLLSLAENSLRENNIRTASEYLVKCAKLGKQFTAARKAHKILRDIIQH